MEKSVRSVLNQTYSPMEIILSDQGSTDGTLEILKKLADEYKGPNTVKVLECPETEYKSMAGLNAHFNWLHKQVEGDLVIMSSADDLNHPQRAEITVEAFNKHNPSYIGTCINFIGANGQNNGFTAPYREEGWVDPAENIKNLVGSSSSPAWARDLWEKYPLKNVENEDILTPFFGSIERGFWYIPVPLYIYVEHANEQNTGMNGVCRAAHEASEKETDPEKKFELEKQEAAFAECNNWHFTSNYFAIARRVQEMGLHVREDVMQMIYQKALDGAGGWALARDLITMNRTVPKLMAV